jgi:hypothetical protein
MMLMAMVLSLRGYHGLSAELEMGIKSAGKKGKAVPLHAMETLGGRGGIATTHSRPRH